MRKSYNPFNRGAHPVGVCTIELIDSSRPGRRIEIEIWYPATSMHRGQDLDDSYCDRFTIAHGMPLSLQRAVRNAEPESGRYPLILCSRAAASHRRDAALLASHLVSHAYVVAAPDFPGDTIGDALADAAALTRETPRRRASDEQIVLDRPRDAIFALDSVVNTVNPACAVIDHDSIATCGVSLGGLDIAPS